MVAAEADRVLPDPAVHREGFQQVRDAHRQELVEDYVELILDLGGDTGHARQVDITARLGVAQPTVAKMLKRLQAMDLVILEPYRSISLTPAGVAMAHASRARHRLCESFLVALGVDPDAARRDAEGIEHHVSEHTLAAFRRFIEDQADQTDTSHDSRRTTSRAQ